MTDTSAMVPSQTWAAQAREFSGAAPLPRSSPTAAGTGQAHLCAVCVGQGNLVPPPAVVTIAGTVYCPSHVA